MTFENIRTEAETPTDFFCKEIEIGDIVAFANIRGATLYYGQVQSMSPKMVTVKDPETGNQTRKFHENVIIVEKVKDELEDILR